MSVVISNDIIIISIEIITKKLMLTVVQKSVALLKSDSGSWAISDERAIREQNIGVRKLGSCD